MVCCMSVWVASINKNKNIENLPSMLRDLSLSPAKQIINIKSVPLRCVLPNFKCFSNYICKFSNKYTPTSHRLPFLLSYYSLPMFRCISAAQSLSLLPSPLVTQDPNCTKEYSTNQDTLLLWSSFQQTQDTLFYFISHLFALNFLSLLTTSEFSAPILFSSCTKCVLHTTYRLICFFHFFTMLTKCPEKGTHTYTHTLYNTHPTMCC